MRRHLLTLSALAVAFTGGLAVADTDTEPNVSCWEDEVVVWSGDTNTHDTCIPIDDFVDIIEP